MFGLLWSGQVVVWFGDLEFAGVNVLSKWRSAGGYRLQLEGTLHDCSCASLLSITGALCKHVQLHLVLKLA